MDYQDLFGTTVLDASYAELNDVTITNGSFTGNLNFTGASLSHFPVDNVTIANTNNTLSVIGIPEFPSLTFRQTSALTATTVKNITPGSNVTINIPDPGVSTANFVLSEGTQTLNGNYTFVNTVTYSSGTEITGDLIVDGTLYSTDIINTNSLQTGTLNLSSIIAKSSATEPFLFRTYGLVPYLRFESAGTPVVLGANPSYLHTYSDYTTFIEGHNGGKCLAFKVDGSSASTAYGIDITPDFKLMKSGTTSHLYVNWTTGNIGIGNENNTYKLDITGALNVSATTFTNNLDVTGTTNTAELIASSSVAANTIEPYSGTNITIASTGMITVNDITINGILSMASDLNLTGGLHVSGTANFTGNTSVNTISSNNGFGIVYIDAPLQVVGNDIFVDNVNASSLTSPGDLTLASNGTGNILLQTGSGYMRIASSSAVINQAGTLAITSADTMALSTTGLTKSMTLTATGDINLNTGIGKYVVVQTGIQFGAGNPPLSTYTSLTLYSGVTVGDGTNNFTLTGATNCRYQRVGSIVHFWYRVVWSSKGLATNAIRVSLPFTIGPNCSRPAFKLAWCSGVPYTGMMVCGGDASNAYFGIYQISTAGAPSTIVCASLAASGELQISGSYSLE